jgi:hypothetical protein
VALNESISDPTRVVLRDRSHHPPSLLSCSESVILADVFEGRTEVRLLAEDADQDVPGILGQTQTVSPSLPEVIKEL